MSETTDQQKHLKSLLQAQKLLAYDVAHNMKEMGLQAHAQRIQEMHCLQEEIERVEAGEGFDQDPSLSPYAQLEHLFYRHIYLTSIGHVLIWLKQTKDFLKPPPDPNIVNTPMLVKAEGAIARSISQGLAWPETEALLKRAEADQSLSAEQKRNLLLMRRAWVFKASMPEEEEVAWAELQSEAHPLWEKAKATNDFELLRPTLTKLFQMAAKRGEAFAKKLGLPTAYEGLLALRNCDITQQQMAEVYGRMQSEAPALIEEIKQVQRAKPSLELPLTEEMENGQKVKKRAIPIAVQERIVRRLGEAMGYDFKRGRLDTATHPFASDNLSDDKRITLNYNYDDCFKSILFAFHEFGHALYEQALPKSLRGQMAGLNHSSWVHESQSTVWEQHIGHTPEFFQYLQPILIEEMKAEDKAQGHPPRDYNGQEWSWQNLYHLNAGIKPNCVRTKADPATYPLHIVVRDLERDIINSGAKGPEAIARKVAAIPAEWNKRTKELLHGDVPNDGQGCLQDMHWTSGYIGHFPVYLMGTVAAAQMKAAMQREIPDLSDRIRQGDFKPIATWLRTHIQEKASTLNGNDLMTQATGAPLNAKSVDHWLTSMREMLITPYTSKAAMIGPDDSRKKGV